MLCMAGQLASKGGLNPFPLGGMLFSTAGFSFELIPKQLGTPSRAEIPALAVVDPFCDSTFSIGCELGHLAGH
jgi:hypothetical protein